jgi:hypothetical protein
VKLTGARKAEFLAKMARGRARVRGRGAPRRGRRNPDQAGAYARTLAEFVRGEGGIRDDNRHTYREELDRVPLAYRRKTGRTPDVLHQAAMDSGLLGEASTPSDLIEALQKGHDVDRTAQGMERERAREGREMAELAAEQDRGPKMRSVVEADTRQPVSRERWRASPFRLNNPQLMVIGNPRRRRNDTARRRQVAIRKPRKRTLAPAQVAHPSSLKRAVAAYRRFHGVPPVSARRLPGKGRGVLISMGALREIVYQPRRGDRRGPAFTHRFGRGAVLAVSPDGQHLYIVKTDGSRMRVDFDRGIIG